MLSNDFIDLLKILIRQPSVVGAEHSFFRALQRELEEQLEALEKARHELRNMTGFDDREQSVAWGLF